MEGELQLRIGRNLRIYRRERGMSQEAFADHLGIHRTYMGDVERGERNLTLRTLERIAERLGLDPLELLAPVEADSPDPALRPRAETAPAREPRA